MVPAIEQEAVCAALTEPLMEPSESFISERDSDAPQVDPAWQQDWFEMALGAEVPTMQPRASWGEDEEEEVADDVEADEEIETDPFDDFNEDDFDDDFDDDYEEELEDEYEIEPADDGAVVETFEEEIELGIEDDTDGAIIEPLDDDEAV